MSPPTSKPSSKPSSPVPIPKTPATKSKPTPIVVDKTAGTSSDSNPSMPSTPPTPSSTRYVRFPKEGSPVTGTSRSASNAEAWSFHHFEIHARGCGHCDSPYSGYKANRRLCYVGRNYAADFLRYVYRKDGKVYSRSSEPGHAIRVEVDKNYHQVRQVLKLTDKYGMSAIEPLPALSVPRPSSSDHRSHHRHDSGKVLYYAGTHPADYAYYPHYSPVSPTHPYPDHHARSPTRPDYPPHRSDSASATVAPRDGYYVQNMSPNSSSSSSKKKGKSRRS